MQLVASVCSMYLTEMMRMDVRRGCAPASNLCLVGCIQNERHHMDASHVCVGDCVGDKTDREAGISMKANRWCLENLVLHVLGMIAHCCAFPVTLQPIAGHCGVLL